MWEMSFYGAVCLVPITLVVSVTRRIVLKKVRLDLLGPSIALITVVVITGIVWFSPPSFIVAGDILKDLRLAPMPRSAAQVRTHEWNSPFSGERYVMFHASREDILEFISRSPVLAGLEVEILEPTPDPPRCEELPRPAREVEGDSKYEPSWYPPTIQGKAKKWTIPGDPKYQGYHNSGELIIDEDNGAVYAKVIWS